MKIDVVGPARRGLAMGLNEFAGYGALSLAALASGYLAATYALRRSGSSWGIIFVLAGLVLSLLFMRESRGHARHEAQVVGLGYGAGIVNNLERRTGLGTVPAVLRVHRP